VFNFHTIFDLIDGLLLAALAGTHFNWRISLVSMKMRMGIVSAIYRKTTKAKILSQGPDIFNLMSTDTDRIVNSCISFHSFWSIPLQLFTTLYLLYTQLGTAFVAGLIFATALIPLNRWISVQIGKLSQSLMTAKDDRIKITREALAGAKQIKVNAWEDVFIKKIEGSCCTKL
jgi:ATP-binding cassette, subfamily C (CFTR/MRP), member 10